MEILNHLLGTCGESHPNLITVSLLVGIVSYFLFIEKPKFKQ